MPSAFELRNRLDAEFGSESDRGCAILTLCVLEEGLVGLVASLLPAGESSARRFVPKGRLSVGVENAFSLGLIDEATRENFSLLVEIRNAFAHQVFERLSFSTPDIQKKVRRLRLPDMQAVPKVEAQMAADPRRRFTMAADGVLFTMEWLAGRVERLARVDNPTWSIRQGPGAA